MGIDEYSNDSRGENDVRPYVSEETHEMVRMFTSRAGMNISDGYDTIVQTVIANDKLVESVLSENSTFDGKVTRREKQLLEDLAKKADVEGEFPDRDAINEDSDLNGFPIYVLHLGSLENAKELIEDSDIRLEV